LPIEYLLTGYEIARYIRSNLIAVGAVYFPDRLTGDVSGRLRMSVNASSLMDSPTPCISYCISLWPLCALRETKPFSRQLIPSLRGIVRGRRDRKEMH